MSDAADARLQRLLGGNHLAPLRKRLRGRFERAPLDAAIETIRIDKLTAEEHAALASLLGRSQRYTSSLQIDVRLVDTALQSASIAGSLRNALEQLDGPITHLAAARLRQQTLWSEAVDRCAHPDLLGLLRAPTGLGLLKRLARQDAAAGIELCRRAEAVLQRLPAKGIARSQLAADALGDAHALDTGQATATLVLAVWRQAAPEPDDKNDDEPVEPADDANRDAGGSAERDRDIWARAGVLVNELARPALFLNLPTRGAGDARSSGEPCYASLRSLLRSPPAWTVANRTVYVCENPNLVAIAADHWGPDCAPLVCTDGMPAAAQRCLLIQLAKAGARLCYHGDFDWPGLRIGNHVIREYGARPWRFCAADYADAARAVSSLGHPLAGSAIDAVWDPALTTAMQQRGLSIAEEAVAAALLQDLGDR
jgi:uncharacterized protein (TIGR02679 family)